MKMKKYFITDEQLGQLKATSLKDGEAWYILVDIQSKQEIR